MKYYEHILEYYDQLNPDWLLPKGIEIIFPFNGETVKKLMRQFYRKFYDDYNDRHFLFGINPGRLGAGMTGIPFTDPTQLEQVCGIENNLEKKQELSSSFIYEMIERYGGVNKFYNRFYISSVCPLGFLKESKNYNYYDSQELLESVEPKIIDSIHKQLKFPCKRDKAFSIGQGKNLAYLNKLNKTHQWFDEIIALPHPRWVLQYRRKNKDLYLDEYHSKLAEN